MELKQNLASVTTIFLFGYYAYTPIYAALTLLTIYNSLLFVKASGAVMDMRIAYYWFCHFFITGFMFRVGNIFLFWIPFYSEMKLLYLFVMKDPGNLQLDSSDKLYGVILNEVFRVDNNKIEFLKLKMEESIENTLKLYYELKQRYTSVSNKEVCGSQEKTDQSRQSESGGQEGDNDPEGSLAGDGDDDSSTEGEGERESDY